MRAVKISSKNKQQFFSFSKRLTIFDVISWTIITLALIALMFLMPGTATYCVSMQTTITAAYVSLRLGYSGKALVQNYKKISNAMNFVEQEKGSKQESQSEDGGNG